MSKTIQARWAAVCGIMVVLGTGAVTYAQGPSNQSLPSGEGIGG